MKNSKLPKTISSFVLLVYFITQAIAFDGVVLCKSSYGLTVAIEFANEGCCAEESTLRNSDSHKHSNKAEHSITQRQSRYCDNCSDCEEFLLVFLSSNQSFKKSITPLRPSAQRTPPPFFIVDNQPMQFASTSPPPQLPFNNFPSFLRTTILLI